MKPFTLLRGLAFRSHDADRLASIIVSSFIRHQDRVDTTKILALERWRAWAAEHQPHRLRPCVSESLRSSSLHQVIDVFNDLFFLGQLPSSKFRLSWSPLGSEMLGQARPGKLRTQVSLIELSLDHHLLRHSLEVCLRTILHEMIHIFFGIYACYPWGRATSCSSKVCRTLYQANMGWTGHGRAWQHVAEAIEKVLPSLLGLRADLGRSCGAAAELQAGSCLPCVREAKQLYSGFPRSWWQGKMRARDDDAVLHRGLAMTPRRWLAWAPRVKKGGRRRNSI